MANERTPMYCVKCGQATYDAKYCDDCRCVFCPDSDIYCKCSPCKMIIYRDAIYGDEYCDTQQLPGQHVCYEHYCPVCLSEHRNDNPLPYFGRYCSGCYKFEHSYGYACISCGKRHRFLSLNGNCNDCECLYCDNIHCIVHKCLLCNHRISFNDPDLKYCDDHSCQRCVYEPAFTERFCAECSVNRTVGTHTKRAN